MRAVAVEALAVGAVTVGAMAVGATAVGAVAAALCRPERYNQHETVLEHKYRNESEWSNFIPSPTCNNDKLCTMQ